MDGGYYGLHFGTCSRPNFVDRVRPDRAVWLEVPGGVASVLVRIIDAPGCPGGKAVALCDDEGDMLPMQSRAVLDNGVDHTTITVTFQIDGNLIRFAD